jgi:hypothetical protein
MHLFGLLGTMMFAVGFITSAYIGTTKLIKLYHQEPSILITDNPWFYIALVAMLLGSQFFLSGFLGELILRSKRDQKRYTIDKKINL